MNQTNYCCRTVSICLIMGTVEECVIVSTIVFISKKTRLSYSRCAKFYTCYHTQMFINPLDFTLRNRQCFLSVLYLYATICLNEMELLLSVNLRNHPKTYGSHNERASKFLGHNICSTDRYRKYVIYFISVFVIMIDHDEYKRAVDSTEKVSVKFSAFNS